MSLNIVSIIKTKLINLPYPIGKLVSHLPFKHRPSIGKVYKLRTSDLTEYDAMNGTQKQQFIFDRVKSLAIYAYQEVEFYKAFYKEKGFDPEQLQSFEDLKKIPIINKSILQKYALELRSNNTISSYVENTGGSSGNPLELRIEPSSVGHEWAHMHKVWSKVGFKSQDLRIVFSGRSNVKDVVQYDSARHQLNVDTYVGWGEVANKLLDVFDHYKPSYLHGYPSAIFDFVLWLDANNHPLLDKLKVHINGMMLGSEYPNPALRDQVESILSCDSVSWYGHTERCVLAYEKHQKQVYEPFQTYGFTEAVEMDGDLQLVATSYYNFAHPLIRYNTEDIISAKNSSLLDEFTISKGRDGEYILDHKGNKVFLTALIFGRHHKLFDYCSSIQIKQSKAGEATILFVPREQLTANVTELFDSSNLDLVLDFKEIAKPVKTVSGKTPLLVKEI
ncbi:phenylacetate--CoA ligase family protein [Pseudoalteromonas luteoviolacea]|uniref:Coenzyme F390 synthetase n=1 Tax=Pseudoalteromonas luteoviolacea DSM 6061 TaxID=1365250 RepID=A0A166XL55_9GAMM|nr:phenylacetate--CoA ligase family protein [Pseudoalteromonas luteoviolacea]KZN40502.1 hypothetical protein N475_12035 [Pseudoalteromonas luteoviolacea DSM 6061]KZN59350.1 hypothetical protein N474_06560 [Pseudoalteromonas luteoviolacea CPMOR-2]MBE0387372.1 phenylacetate-CoA ligase [Pseudoalteromonas luteoviolacea DSM 6061]TQF72189.1 phenylacetate--CoA ligase family protein [Pseudoalteromonas luteoviolacea]